MESRFSQQASFGGRDWGGDSLITDLRVRQDGRWQVVKRHSAAAETGLRLGEG